MEQTDNYIVFLDNVRANERIIFKLICSVSQRSKGRNKRYSITADLTDAKVADIVIGDLAHKDPQAATLPARLFTAWIADDTAEQNTILRPLIATRVLTTLDKLVEQNQPTLLRDEQPVIHSPSSETGEPQQELELTDFSFDISEEEASELAIVQDEALANPANDDEVVVLQSLPSSVTRIVDASAHNTETGAIHENRLPRALVVDDSPSVRKQLELELDLFDVDVDYAETAEEAFGFLQKQHYDIAFLDVVLPDKDGFQICKQIKSTSKDTIAIMLTGKSTQSDKIKGSLSGCDAYLVKPVGRETFQNAARNSLALKEQVNIAGV